ncbi:hypothetical protein CC78DRAFT_581868 [Lojkania enalia]|uniref:Uncharacterized protein n=1 Tax=Lojkania enalia TaxID=147567 RepID=A0A9P4N5B6_9PLEO|nr:hypothetical protein CC78DRAFT_581868 [Didymosphaeria enalia]
MARFGFSISDVFHVSNFAYAAYKPSKPAEGLSEYKSLKTSTPYAGDKLQFTPSSECVAHWCFGRIEVNTESHARVVEELGSKFDTLYGEQQWGYAGIHTSTLLLQLIIGYYLESSGHRVNLSFHQNEEQNIEREDETEFNEKQRNTGFLKGVFHVRRSKNDQSMVQVWRHTTVDEQKKIDGLIEGDSQKSKFRTGNISIGDFEINVCTRDPRPAILLTIGLGFLTRLKDLQVSPGSQMPVRRGDLIYHFIIEYLESLNMTDDRKTGMTGIIQQPESTKSVTVGLPQNEVFAAHIMFKESPAGAYIQAIKERASKDLPDSTRDINSSSDSAENDQASKDVARVVPQDMRRDGALPILTTCFAFRIFLLQPPHHGSSQPRLTRSLLYYTVPLLECVFLGLDRLAPYFL